MNTVRLVTAWMGAHLSFHLMLYTLIVLLLLYKPPASMMTHLKGIGDFISRHWGDSIGLYLIHLGILLDILAGLYSQLSDVGHVGESFILTGVAMLKLKYIPKEGTDTTIPPVTVTTTNGGYDAKK